MSGRWTTAERLASIDADLAHMRDEQRAAQHRRSQAVDAEVRGMELQYQARAARTDADWTIAVLAEQIDAQLEARAALVPEPREP